MIHQPLSPDGVHPPNQFIPEIVSPCLVRPYLFVINYCLFAFFKELFSFIRYLDKCHTNVFNALMKKSNFPPWDVDDG